MDALIGAEFSAEEKEVPDYMDSIKPSPIPPENNLSIFIEMNDIIVQVNAACTSHNKQFCLDPKAFIGV